jgi:hypothetical protein
VRQIGALALVLALSACGSDPEPRFDDDPTPTVAPSSAEPSKEPWEEKSDDGAIAFVEHWIDEFNAMRVSGEPDELLQLSTPKCESCQNFADLTRQIYGAGGSVITKGWSPLSVSRPAEANSVRPTLSVRVKQAPQVLRESKQSKPVDYDGGTVDLVAHLKWARGRWLMDRLDLA